MEESEMVNKLEAYLEFVKCTKGSKQVRVNFHVYECMKKFCEDRDISIGSFADEAIGEKILRELAISKTNTHLEICEPDVGSHPR